MNLHKVENEFLNLKALKDKYSFTEKAKVWADKANMKEYNESIDENDFRTQISAVVKRQKDAEISASMPEWDFIPLDDDGQVNRKIIRSTWDYHWLISNTDKVINKIIGQATTFGTGIMYEGIRHIYKTINEPYIIDGELKFREKKIIKSEIFCDKIPFQNFFINGTDIDNSTVAIVVRSYQKDQYIKEKQLSPIYKNINKIKDSAKYTGIDNGIEEDVSSDAGKNDIVVELSYWNIATDEYIVLANGIEILNTHIPYSHKELPFCIFIDNEAEDRFWGIGEFELLERDELAKNEYRSLTIKGVKASIGFILKDAGSDLDPANMQFGLQEILETNDIDGIQHFAPNVPIRDIAELERKLDDDIIAKSGVDFKNLLLSPSESATRTQTKSDSARKRINKCLKDNAFSFYRRLGNLRLKNIQQLHSSPIRIPIKGGSINNGIFVSDETGAYGSAIIGADFTKGDFLVMPVVDTMLGNSSERRKKNLEIFMQLAGNIQGPNQQPVIKGAQLVKIACDEWGYDYEKLTEEVLDSKSAEDIVNNIMGTDGSTNPNDPRNPSYVGEFQRSQRPQVPTISGSSEQTQL